MRKAALFLFGMMIVALVGVAISAQTTEFTYQGSMQSSGSPANGNYDFEFRLYDAASAGNQIGTTVVSRNNVVVSNGIFSVAIDFGNAGIGTPPFPGADRYLDIRVRASGGGAFTALAPRNRVNSSPYAIQSLRSTDATTANNALALGGVAASQYVVTTDPRMTDARPPTPGSANYIQNTAEFQQFAGFDIGGIARIRGDLTVDGLFTANLPPNNANYIQNRSSQQSLSNFNISGTGTANIINATTQYNIDGNRVLGATNSNTFLGRDTGVATTGFENSFFGSNAGRENTTGVRNAFFGFIAGVNNQTGNRNSFFGVDAGVNNTIGDYNSFFGSQAGIDNTTGSNNTIIGTFADVASGNLTYATAIGSNSVVSASNTIALGRSNGSDSVRAYGNLTVNGNVTINTLGGATAVNLCTNFGLLSLCSSSLRYKNNVASFASGMDVLSRLRPVTFNWNESGERDLGLIAEETEAVDPLLVTYNKDGQIQGVKYDQLTVVLINAIKEQQAEIDQLRQIVCSLKPDAKGCLPK